MKLESIDPQVFKKILKRNVTIPLVISIFLCGAFIALVVNLLNANKWVNHTDRVLALANQSIKLIVDSETGLRGYLVSGNKDFLDPHYRADKLLEERFTELQKLVSDNQSQSFLIGNIRQKYKDWLLFVNEATVNRYQVLDQVKKGFDLKKDLMDSIRSDFTRFGDVERELRNQRTEATESQTVFLLLATIFLSLGSGVALAFTGRKQLMNLSDSYSSTLQKQHEQNAELAHHSWLRSGQAELSNRIVGEKTIEEIGKEALSFIANYVQASLGTLFVLENSKLYRVSEKNFTQDENPFSKKSYNIGEGFIGEVAQTKKLLVLENLPENYLKVSTSLGEGSPRVATLVPLMSEGVLQGVMELGFLNPLLDDKKQFLDNISETLGTGIKSALYRSKLQQLLEETQTQSEELQAQQEELKISNEELTQRSDALMRTQTRLENQHAELEQATSELEEQRQALDVQNKSLKAIQVDLERASQYKSEFLANMSHELRTPLNSSLILSKLLKDNKHGNLTAEQVEFAETIYASGNDLLNLINDILDLSKVEAGKLDIVYEAFPLDTVISNMKNQFSSLAKDKGLEFKVNLAPNMPRNMETDRLRVEQILKNLLSNALKFTQKGTVTLDISLANQNEVAFKVIDSGIGISRNHLDLIFEAFRQADGTTNRKFGGTGLGLTISRNLASLLGGQITVESEEGKGSAFTLLIPIHKTAVIMKSPEVGTRHDIEAKTVYVEETTRPYVEDDEAALPSPGRKILLVVEDDVPFAQVIRNLAHENDYICLIATTGDRGYELALKYRPDAIILDIRLPDTLGLTVLDRLKDNPLTRHIPVHAISGADYAKEALRLGAIGYLHKPIKIENVKEVFTKLNDKIERKNKEILVVEDNTVQRDAIVKMIEGPGIKISSTGMGKEALELLTSKKFDCVIIDLSLPDISGLEVLKQLSSNKESTYPPIIIYTARSLSTEEENMLRQYSETIIIKGARSPERLLTEVSLFLHQVESQMSEEKQWMMKEIRSREKGFEGRKILIADDDARNIFALLSLLESKGAKAIVGRNGREALELLEENTDVDLILMDIMMPEMDGYTAIRKIRSEPKYDKTPIIAVTAKAMRNDFDKCMQAGANDYLAKPVDVEKLVSLMRVWIPVS